MPSPFPGMAPFIEAQEWEDFHATFNTVVRELLTPALKPRYLVRVERRVYVEQIQDEFGSEEPLPGESRVGDVVIVASGRGRRGTRGGSATALLTPVVCEAPVSLERRESYLVIRERRSLEIVTVIETLSPANERGGSDGRAEYLAKRDHVLRSPSNLVEFDLLRRGRRLPLRGRVPAGDYFALLHRVSERPRVEVYAWPLEHVLPTIPIPLKTGDPDVPLDLQAAFNTVYDRAAYELSIDYRARLSPPLPAKLQRFVRL